MRRRAGWAGRALGLGIALGVVLGLVAPASAATDIRGTGRPRSLWAAS